MIGAIVVVGLVAAMSSAMATLNNWTVSRRFPGLPYDMSPDTPLDIYVRVTCYRLVAKLPNRSGKHLEKIDTGAITTPFMKAGDTVRIEMLDKAGKSIFGKIDQKVVAV